MLLSKLGAVVALEQFGKEVERLYKEMKEESDFKSNKHDKDLIPPPANIQHHAFYDNTYIIIIIKKKMDLVEDLNLMHFSFDYGGVGYGKTHASLTNKTPRKPRQKEEENEGAGGEEEAEDCGVEILWGWGGEKYNVRLILLLIIIITITF